VKTGEYMSEISDFRSFIKMKKKL